MGRSDSCYPQRDQLPHYTEKRGSACEAKTKRLVTLTTLWAAPFVRWFARALSANDGRCDDHGAKPLVWCTVSVELGVVRCAEAPQVWYGYVMEFLG